VRLTEAAIAHWRAHLQPGDHVLDATAGNGHDTRALAEIVGPTGHVWALDRQEAALKATRRTLEQSRLDERADVTLWQGEHATLKRHLPDTFAHQPLTLVVFNLGYLPGADHAVTTTARSTLAALDFLVDHLAPGGAFSIMAYRGHPGGLAEAEAVAGWLNAKKQAGWPLQVTEPDATRSLPPIWFWAVKNV